ncbi:rRNA methyltransferase 2, mitochondrial [Chrysoperla carnea]|uniref:rRNA methyltransferase 2, mitochondrial n=1 Tax=Chrysoperla carnea TaxID=189513 RepID=UPI001D09232F|nr:rRNA methyltransferase 2, mitochondrial [Chrysoperla carnea]
MVIYRKFSTGLKLYEKIVPTNLKGKKVSSQQWLTRQLNDPYVEKAKMMNYRCRSAFKLIEIDDKNSFLKPGQTVIDCGAAPGSWTQVAVLRCNADGKQKKKIGTVIGIDKLQIYPLEGAQLLGNMDFTLKESQLKILQLLNNAKLDVVLSDMAPNATGVRSMDQENILNLCYSVLKFAVQMSNDGGTLLVKVWDGGGVPKLCKDIEKFYNHVKIIKPNASRSDSAEKFLLGRGFKGLKTTL